MRAHTDFHFALYEACGAPWLLRMIRPAWDRTERFRPALFSAAGELQDRHREIDGELLEAVSAHDPDRAAETLHEHLELAGRFYGPELGEGGSSPARLPPARPSEAGAAREVPGPAGFVLAREGNATFQEHASRR